MVWLGGSLVAMLPCSASAYLAGGQHGDTVAVVPLARHQLFVTVEGCFTTELAQVINGAAKTWGLECLRYEIKDIVPPPAIVKAMELQAEAERRKRAQVLESEGVRQATINESEAQRVRPLCLLLFDS